MVVNNKGCDSTTVSLIETEAARGAASRCKLPAEMFVRTDRGLFVGTDDSYTKEGEPDGNFTEDEQTLGSFLSILYLFIPIRTKRKASSI